MKLCKMKKTSSVPDLLHAGVSPTAIARQLGISRRSIYKIKKKMELTGTNERKAGSGRKRSARTKSVIDKVKSRLKRNPVRSMRKMAKELNISLTSVRRIVKEDLKMKSRARLKVPLLTTKQKKARMDRAKALLNNIKHAAPGRVMLFTDEKIFTVDASLNRRNDRWIGNEPENYSDEVRYRNTTKHPSSVMVFGLVASDGRKMPPVFVKAGVKINTEAYIEILSTKVLPWLKANYPQQNYVFQQDGAPAHTSNRTQEWLNRNMAEFWSKEMWPPQSPDLNPLDYSVWANVEKDACKTSHTSVAALKRAITNCWKKMTVDYIVGTCNSFRHRLESVVRAKGGHIEK